MLLIVLSRLGLVLGTMTEEAAESVTPVIDETPIWLGVIGCVIILAEELCFPFPKFTPLIV